jgi:hypothetical protein
VQEEVHRDAEQDQPDGAHEPAPTGLPHELRRGGLAAPTAAAATPGHPGRQQGQTGVDEGLHAGDAPLGGTLPAAVLVGVTDDGFGELPHRVAKEPDHDEPQHDLAERLFCDLLERSPWSAFSPEPLSAIWAASTAISEYTRPRAARPSRANRFTHGLLAAP